MNEQASPPIQIYATDIEDLYVTQDPLAVHLLEVDALNVEEDMDLLPSLKFLAHNTGRRLSQLEGRLAGNGCSLRSKSEGGRKGEKEYSLEGSVTCYPHSAAVPELPQSWKWISVLRRSLFWWMVQYSS